MIAPQLGVLHVRTYQCVCPQNRSSWRKCLYMRNPLQQEIPQKVSLQLGLSTWDAIALVISQSTPNLNNLIYAMSWVHHDMIWLKHGKFWYGNYVEKLSYICSKNTYLDIMKKRSCVYGKARVPLRLHMLEKNTLDLQSHAALNND